MTGIDGERRRVADASKDWGLVSMTMPTRICLTMAGCMGFITIDPRCISALGMWLTLPFAVVPRRKMRGSVLFSRRNDRP